MPSHKDIEKYRDLEAEYDLLVDICSPFYDIKHKLERRESSPRHAELLSEGIIADAASYIKKLERRMNDNDNERAALAATCLLKDHGICLGEKIPYNHPGTEDSGYVRAEKVSFHLRPDTRADMYFVTGRRFRKDGKLGKLLATAYLRVKESTPF